MNTQKVIKFFTENANAVDVTCNHYNCNLDDNVFSLVVVCDGIYMALIGCASINFDSAEICEMDGKSIFDSAEICEMDGKSIVLSIGGKQSGMITSYQEEL